MHQAYYMAGYINISFNSVEEHIVNVNIMNLNRGTQVRELVDTSVMSIVCYYRFLDRYRSLVS